MDVKSSETSEKLKDVELVQLKDPYTIRMNEEAKTKIHEKLIVERDAHLREKLKSQDNKKLKARTCTTNNFCGISKVHMTWVLPTH